MSAGPYDERSRKHRDRFDSDMDPASGWLDAEDFEPTGYDDRELREDQDRRLPTFTRQVCARLSYGQFQDLEHAASIYGVAPSTMARMLIRRGARSVVEAHRRYDGANRSGP